KCLSDLRAARYPVRTGPGRARRHGARLAPPGSTPEVSPVSVELAVKEPEAAVWTRRHLLDLEELSRVGIETILDTAENFVEISQRRRKKRSDLKGKVVVNLFFEPSTRTRSSFGFAAKRLSADVFDFTSSGSSLSKGETFIDTAKNIEAMGIDVM